MSFYKIIIRENLSHQKSGSPRTPSKIQVILWGFFGLMGLSILTTLLFASAAIALLLAIPFIFLGLLWILTLVLRGKIRIRRDSFFF